MKLNPTLENMISRKVNMIKAMDELKKAGLIDPDDEIEDSKPIKAAEFINWFNKKVIKLLKKRQNEPSQLLDIDSK